MKALILAAGFGTRLLPHTEHLPKPLFPVNGRPVLDIAICRLIQAGMDGIIVNTHHLHEQIAAFINSRHYAVPVVTRREKKILGTGGAIRNVSDFLGTEPFLVVNSDILTDIPFQAVTAFHQRHPHPATLVMHDYPEFNNVQVEDKNHIFRFGENTHPDTAGPLQCLAFTGIHVLDPSIMQWIPENCFVSIIDVYRDMMRSGLKIKAYIAKKHQWRDMGTPESFFEAAYDASTPLAFEKAFGARPKVPVPRTRLSGDGSDRRWFRLGAGDRTIIMADHGIQDHTIDRTTEVDAFIHIGRHLFDQGVPVPQIYHSDAFSGLVYVEDIGDTHLQTLIQGETDTKTIIERYRQVIDHLIHMSFAGGKSFHPSWTWQTAAYDKELILERECRYFVNALLDGYLGMETVFDDLFPVFNELADQALENAEMGFMHRDFQSRNILVRGEQVYFIDFQAGRTGPLQYDLASLLTDPYVNLSPEIQDDLLDYGINRLSRIRNINRKHFLSSYEACALSRILQSLGAFGHLTKVKNKPFFEPFIPIALANLDRRLASLSETRFQPLADTVTNAINQFYANRKAQ